jgi:UDP-N-acetylglucosamine:LPS N-acetylglucosamine transferase
MGIDDLQNYMAASDMAIIKAGWSSVAEALIGGTPMVLIKRPGVIEDTQIIRTLEAKGMAISISQKALLDLDVDELHKSVKSMKKNRTPNNLHAVATHILEIVSSRKGAYHYEGNYFSRRQWD